MNGNRYLKRAADPSADKSRRLVAALISAALIVAATVQVALAQPSQPAPPASPPGPAEALFLEGRALVEQKRFGEACEKFEEARKLNDKGIGILLNLGLCHASQDKVATALFWYRKVLTLLDKNNDTVQVDAANKRIDELQPLVPILEVKFTTPAPDGTKIQLDGKEVAASDWGRIEVDPGEHEISIQVPKQSEQKSKANLVLRGRVQIEGRLDVAKAPGAVPSTVPTKWKRNGLIAMGAGGGLLLGSLIYATSVCGFPDGDPCKTKQNESPRGQLLPANIMAGAGVAAIGVGAYYLLFAKKTESSTKTVLVPYAEPSSVGFALSGTF